MPDINCNLELEADFLRDCDNPPVAGITDVVALINYGDIDRATTTFNTDNSQIVETLVLKAGKRAYRVEGRDTSNNALAALVEKDAPAVNAWSHTYAGTAMNVDAVALDNLTKMAQGGSYVAIVERKYKGANNESAFMILGYTSGLKLRTADYSANENSGTLPFTLASADDQEEPKTPYIWLDTDYAITTAAFEALFGGY
jgi:hypothetical protein